MNDNLRPLSELGLSETLLEKVLSRALSRGGDFADVFFEDSRLRSLQWEESKLKSSSMVLTRGLGIRVISGEKTGYAYTDEISEEALLHAADTASHIAESSRDFSVSLQTRKSASNFYPLKHPFGEKGAGSMLSYLETLQKAAASFDPKVEKIMAGIGENQREILIANSEGLLVRDFRPMVRCNLSVIAEKDGRRENAYEGIGGRQDLESLTEERL
ncbi:MAG: DNA gyrase modulator, partial [Candidatus Krumholzibacteria bacterium]|nr:DNA gyrase modulator [Candidatus Krumholzibacteria bacterium]